MDKSLSTAQSHSSNTLADRIGATAFRVGAGVLWAYGCAVFPFGRLIPGISPLGTGAIFIAGLAIIIAAPGIDRQGRFLSRTRALDLGMMAGLVTLVLLGGDLALAARENWMRADVEGQSDLAVRERDSTVWHGELYPRMYVPAGQTFSLYKPNTRVSGSTFGERYVSAMMKSPTLAREVLERRQLSYSIGPEGLREIEPLSASRIFALGDSFAFGFATDEGLIWTDLLGGALGAPVYNLGVSATGPRQQVDLLKYMFATHGDAMRPKHVLWMLFEGNDLENSYGAMRSADAPSSRADGFLAGTAVEPLFTIPERIRNTSMVRKLLRGELTLSAGPTPYGRYEIDGVRLTLPLFHSSKFGYRLFTPADIEAATKPSDYVVNHPNRPLLDQTFREMRQLAHDKGFEVTVVIAPSDARLYGRAFEGFPALSDEPHFVNYLAKLAGEMGFPVINLLALLQPFAESELLYYRDDHHWNVRGNQVVAELIHRALAGE